MRLWEHMKILPSQNQKKEKKNFQVEENGSMYTLYMRVYVHTVVRCAARCLCGGKGWRRQWCLAQPPSECGPAQSPHPVVMRSS